MRTLILLVAVGLLVTGTLYAQTFTRITQGDIVNDGGASYGMAWGDYDNDGYPDLFVANGGPDTNYLYQNNGDGTFSKIFAGGIVNDRDWSYSGTWGDYDNDGDLDLFVANSGPDYNDLYKNNSDGTFTKITTGPLANDRGSSMNGSWGDYDKDGDLDLFVANRYDHQNNYLYWNNGDGAFTKITDGDIVNDGGDSFSGTWGDYDNDGDLDLFGANGGESLNRNNYLYQNNGDGTFNRITNVAIVNDGGHSNGASWGDYDNDGDLDLFVANTNHQNNFLYRNNGDGTFTKITDGDIVNDGGDSRGSTWGDYDNDGDLDLFVTNSSNQEQNNFLYSNNGDGSFTRVTSGHIVSSRGHHSLGSGSADYDRDGDLDLFVANDGPDNFLYKNDGNTHNWINIKAIGTLSNTCAFGARISVLARINGQPVRQLREVSAQTGGGFGGQNSLNAAFGLGDATVIDSVRITWPSGAVETFSDVTVNQFILATEGNLPPLAAQDSLVLAEDQALSIPVLANDTDPDDHPLSVTLLETTGLIGTAEITADGQAINYTPQQDFYGEERFHYTISDGNLGGQTEGEVILTITSVNDAPPAPAIATPTDGAELAIEGDPATVFSAVWIAVDDVEGDTVRYSWQLALSDDFAEAGLLLSVDTGTEPRYETDFSAVAALLTEAGIETGSEVTAYHRVLASDGELTTSSAVATLTLTRGLMTDMESETTLPTTFALLGNYPNPFNPVTTLRFDLPEAAQVGVEVMDALGRRVLTVPEQPVAEGANRALQLDASVLPSGVYLYRVIARMQSQTQVDQRLMVLLK